MAGNWTWPETGPHTVYANLYPRSLHGRDTRILARPLQHNARLCNIITCFYITPGLLVKGEIKMEGHCRSSFYAPKARSINTQKKKSTRPTFRLLDATPSKQDSSILTEWVTNSKNSHLLVVHYRLPPHESSRYQTSV